MPKDLKIIYEPHPVSPERKRELLARGYKIIDAQFQPEFYLREDGPTVAEFVAAGYLAANYPPDGYVSRSTTDEINALVAEQSSVANSQSQSASSADEKALDAPAYPQAGSGAALAPDGLDAMDAEQLHALAKERGVSVHHKAGADKVREALRQVA